VISMWIVFMTVSIWSSSPLLSWSSVKRVHSLIELNVSLFNLSHSFWNSVRNFLYSEDRKSIYSIYGAWLMRVPWFHTLLSILIDEYFWGRRTAPYFRQISLKQLRSWFFPFLTSKSFDSALFQWITPTSSQTSCTFIPHFSGHWARIQWP
jgi:hypothetical protein